MNVPVKTDLQRYDILQYGIQIGVKKNIQPFRWKNVLLRLDNFFLQSAIHVAILLYFVSQTCND